MKIGTTLRKTGKILLITFLSLILLLVIVVTIALHSEKTITDLALEEVSEMFDAPIKVDEVRLLLFRNFPYATVEFSGLKLGVANKQYPDSVSYDANDTLLSLRKFYVSVKSRPLMNNKIEIHKIEIEGFAFNYLVDSTGATNIDFLMASDTTAVEPEEEPLPVDTSASVLDMLLQNLTIRDITVNFRDNKMGASAKIHIPEMDISGRVLDEYYAGKIKGSVVLSNADFEGTNLSFMKKSSLAFDIDYEDGKVKVQAVDFLTDGAQINAAGYAVLSDSIFVDMGVNLTHVDLKELSKYAPVEMLREYGVLSIDGKINIDTKIKGYYYDTLLLPAIETKISMSGGKVKTTEYPELAELSMSGNVFVPDANDMSTMSAKFSSVKIATPKSTINLAFDVTNFVKPRYALRTNGTITLDEFNDFLPDSTVEYISGGIDFALATNGVLPSDLGMSSADYFLDRTLLEVHFHNIATAVDAETEVKNFSADFYYNPSRDVALTNLTVSVPSYNVSIDNFTVKTKILGSVNDIDNMGVNVDSLFFKMGNTSLVAKATVRGLKVPTYTLDANLQVDLDELRPHIPDTLVQHIAGRIGLKVNSYGTVDLDSVETQMVPIAFEQTTMQLDVADFSFAMPDDTLAKINSLNFSFAMANDTMRLDRFHANAHGIDMWIDSTEIWNVYKAMLLEQKDKSIIVNAYINLGNIDYAQFEPLMEEEEPEEPVGHSIAPVDNSRVNNEGVSQNNNLTQTNPENTTPKLQEGTRGTGTSASATASSSSAKGETEEEMYIPPYIARGTFGVKSVKYGDILLNDIATKFRVDDSLYVIDQFKFNAFGGSMVTSAVYDVRIDTATIISFKNVIKGMDINQLLVDANDFDQEEFTHDNVSGKLTSDFNGRIVMNGDSVLYDKINIMGDFTLQDGGLFNYKPVVELSKTPVPGLNDLDSIVFNEMQSSVFIYKNNIYFPKTDIVSTALDISAFGMQSFDEDFEYHLIVHFGDVLWGKSEKLLKEQGYDSDVFDGKDESERRGTALIAMDKEGKKKYGPDSKALRRMMSTKIRLMKTGLSFIFHPRLVNFSTSLDRKEGVTREAEDK